MEKYILTAKEIPSILYHVAYSSISSPTPSPSTAGLRAPSWLARYPYGPSFTGGHNPSQKRAIPDILTIRKLFLFEMDNHIKVSNVPQLYDMGSTHPSSFVTLLASRHAVEREMEDRNRSGGNDWKVWKIDGTVLEDMGVKVLRLRDVFRDEKELVFPPDLKEARRAEFVVWSDVPVKALRGGYGWKTVTLGQADPFDGSGASPGTQSAEQVNQKELLDIRPADLEMLGDKTYATLSPISPDSHSSATEPSALPNPDGSFTFQKIISHWPKSAKGPSACTSYLIRWGPHAPNSYNTTDAMNPADIEAYWIGKRKKGHRRNKNGGEVKKDRVVTKRGGSTTLRSFVRVAKKLAERPLKIERPRGIVGSRHRFSTEN